MIAHHDMIRTNYDTVAAHYADIYTGELHDQPVERAMLALFAELAGDAHGTIGDLGCGPGRVAAYLHRLGLTDLLGVDLSPAMIAEARRRYPGPRFEVGSIDNLDFLGDGVLGAAIAWYSIIHTPRELVPAMLAEFRRVIRPGGPLLLGFHAAEPDDPGLRRHIESAYGHDGLSLDAYRWVPEDVRGLLADAGFTVHTTVIREREGGQRTRQAFLLAD